MIPARNKANKSITPYGFLKQINKIKKQRNLKERHVMAFGGERWNRKAELIYKRSLTLLKSNKPNIHKEDPDLKIK